MALRTSVRVVLLVLVLETDAFIKFLTPIVAKRAGGKCEDSVTIGPKQGKSAKIGRLWGVRAENGPFAKLSHNCHTTAM